jgi:hypothetical protein
MRELTQGCEDGGDIWLSHVGANEVVAGRMCLTKHLLLPMRRLVVAVVQVCALVLVGRIERERDKEEEAGRGRKWQARTCFTEFLAKARALLRTMSDCFPCMASLKVTW